MRALAKGFDSHACSCRSILAGKGSLQGELVIAQFPLAGSLFG
jgi:hypothetical protein